ncbi:uncharacterized protein LOC132904299 [Amyelois transitella]|uniref:uncharacterized protein LOC106139388 n=2 Tax=Amyelois transitella TaxID=680683 RepID=UPI00298FB9FC|nr:uncharacterized protein LOC106139388 [Amyelois transitella]XP_060801303.1 uncharacterized protein LOC132901954 [Amyelois transitella]XP_060804294.1 uncharacterized protein LOC132902565 [Amyelois transitella]XP_060807337.1 uncharacterized protein LOC106139492 [Amyelois transitella]XP_060810212.1 uncharacterized protein LOC132904299 [Amyelois transitella]
MSDNLAKVYKSNRGGLKLHYEGFSYYKNKVNNTKFYWCCDSRKHYIYKCCATLVTEVNSANDMIHNVLKCSNKHNHEPNPLDKEISDFRQKLKEDARTGLKVCQILQNNQSDCTPEFLDHLPSQSALKQVMYRARSKVPKKKEPTDILFEIDESEMQINGQCFVIKDRIYNNNKRILLLSTKNMMQLLQQADFWVLDGTFKIVPHIFQQLYTIHGNLSVTGNKTKTFPLLYCLCTNKDKKTYDMIFELLQEYGVENDLEFHPKICILDFEKAAIQSLKSNFENVILHGCHFHLGQILYRQVQQRGLTQRYASDIKFKTDVKCLLALSFLPPNEIPIYFNKLLVSYKDDDDIISLAHWFEENYVSGTCSAPARYIPEFWSCELINTLKLPRTQNSAEAWHHHINQIIDKKSPGFYHLIKELIKETIIKESEIEKMLCGSPPEKKRRKYIIKDEKLKKIIEIKENLNEIKYLKEISKII